MDAAAKEIFPRAICSPALRYTEYVTLERSL